MSREIDKIIGEYQAESIRLSKAAAEGVALTPEEKRQVARLYEGVAFHDRIEALEEKIERLLGERAH